MASSLEKKEESFLNHQLDQLVVKDGNDGRELMWLMLHLKSKVVNPFLATNDPESIDIVLVSAEDLDYKNCVEEFSLGFGLGVEAVCDEDDDVFCALLGGVFSLLISAKAIKPPSVMVFGRFLIG